jgi:uncharacterized repeat protein (TIGR03837 family)
MRKNWDIFCKVVDNFGDIGICWRLSKQLAHEHGLQVRLYVDDLQATQKIIPELDINRKNQFIQSIQVVEWQAETQFGDAADVAVEAFACDLPQGYLDKLQASTVWVNLEYLSAELWVDDFHAKHSTRGELTRHFYFPGFTEKTGGLLREYHLIEARNLYWHNAELNSVDELKISLFCYEMAPLQALFHAVSGGTKKTRIYAPISDFLHHAAACFGKNRFEIGDQLTLGNLTLEVLPFLSQAAYDELLWACDINFVRGEDSWIRAIWAGKPFFWQPYPQSESTHIKKLDAFLEVFYKWYEPAKKVAADVHLAWSNGSLTDEVWRQYLTELPMMQSVTLKQSNLFAEQADLASKLVIFCENHLS